MLSKKTETIEFEQSVTAKTHAVRQILPHALKQL